MREKLRLRETVHARPLVWVGQVLPLSPVTSAEEFQASLIPLSPEGFWAATPAVLIILPGFRCPRKRRRKDLGPLLHVY